MKTTRLSYVSLLMFAVAALTCHGDAVTDAELKQDVWEYLTTRFCGSRGGRRIAHPRILTDYIRFDGNTNRLAAVLVEVACSNNTWAAGRAFKELEKYGTPAQLLFLYSCATNPAVANSAVKAVLRIEGVTSNSVAMLQRFLYITNSTPSELAYEKAIASSDFLSSIASSSPEMKECAILAARDFVANVSTGVSRVDEALIAADVTYRYSKRRLSDLRCAYPRCFNEYQTNYVTNAINELVAYPEANLPD